MAKKPASRKTAKKSQVKGRDGLKGALRLWLRWALRKAARVATIAALFMLAMVLVYRFVNPPTTYTIWSESRRLDGVDHEWVPMEDIAPVLRRSVVAAEDANFCVHWGFDMAAIRAALDDGAGRGASTISQQTVKNVFLWQGRSWPRKALEAALTPFVELAWPKSRVLEVYLNVAEFGEGIFGIDAAAHHYYGLTPAKLSPAQSARLAVILPNPKERDPRKLSANLGRRAAQVMDGAATIQADGRASCFDS